MSQLWNSWQPYSHPQCRSDKCTAALTPHSQIFFIFKHVFSQTRLTLNQVTSLEDKYQIMCCSHWRQKSFFHMQLYPPAPGNTHKEAWIVFIVSSFTNFCLTKGYITLLHEVYSQAHHLIHSVMMDKKVIIIGWVKTQLIIRLISVTYTKLLLQWELAEVLPAFWSHPTLMDSVDLMTF